MKRAKNGHTMRQYAYAKTILNPQELKSKKEVALTVGYSNTVANSVKSHIENTEGFDNAMSALASESGNIMLDVMHRLKHHKNLDKLNVPELLSVIDVMGRAWERFTPKSKEPSVSANRLKGILLTRVIDVGDNEPNSLSTSEEKQKA